jgi:hypothetical protein
MGGPDSRSGLPGNESTGTQTPTSQPFRPYPVAAKNALSQFSLHDVRNQTAQPHKTVGKLIIFYNLICTLQDSSPVMQAEDPQLNGGVQF